MARRNPQTAAKRDREQAVKERRDRKRAKKADVAAERAAAKGSPKPGLGGDSLSLEPADLPLPPAA